MTDDPTQRPRRREWTRSMRRLLAFFAALHISANAAPNSDPLELPMKQYGLVLAVALLGGVVSFYAKVRAGHVAAWNVFHLIGEMATSAFAGLLAFWICSYLDTPQLLTVAVVGIAGHMGARAIALFEHWAQRRFQ